MLHKQYTVVVVKIGKVMENTEAISFSFFLPFFFSCHALATGSCSKFGAIIIEMVKVLCYFDLLSKSSIQFPPFLFSTMLIPVYDFARAL